MYEEMIVDTPASLRRVYCFLGADTEVTPKNLEPQNVGFVGPATAVSPDLREIVFLHFRPHNRRLCALVDIDLAPWGC
jgi:hypothetical protein